MAQVTLDLGTATNTKRIIDALCEAHGYTGPDSGKADAAKEYLIAWVSNIVQGVERNRMQEAQPDPQPDEVTIK